MVDTNQALDTLRKRIPFRLQSDTPENDDRILDEQEQEELIEELRKKDAKSSKESARWTTVVVGLSGVLHLIYLLSPGPGTPLTAVMSGSPPDESIPLASFFTILHLILHVNLTQRFLPQRASLRTWLSNNSFKQAAQYIPLSYSWTLATAALAPPLSLLCGRSFPTTLWWSLTAILALFCQVSERWAEEAAVSIQELENMKYTAPGA